MNYISLSDIATFQQGKQVPVENQYEKLEKGLGRFVRIIDYTNPNEPPRYIKDMDPKYHVGESDLVMIRYGSQTAGRVVRGIAGIIANNMFQIKINDSSYDKSFLYHYLSTPDIKKQLMGGQSSSTMPAITFGMMKNVVIPGFDIYTQKKIARFLDLIDEKIKVNRHINDNLEQQAQAIFSTFISDHQTTTVTVEDIVLTANTGADAIQKAPIVDYDTGVRCVRVGDMSNQRPVHEWGFAQVTPEIFKQYQLHKDDIVVTRTASLGLNRLIGENLSAVYNNGLIRISINQDIVYPLIVYRQFQTDDYRNYISRISGETSVRPNMKINYLLKYSFEIPCLSDQAELISILQPIFETQERNISENQTLSSLRDTLLPKLMSGDLDVSKIDL